MPSNAIPERLGPAAAEVTTPDAHGEALTRLPNGPAAAHCAGTPALERLGRHPCPAADDHPRSLRSCSIRYSSNTQMYPTTTTAPVTGLERAAGAPSRPAAPAVGTASLMRMARLPVVTAAGALDLSLVPTLLPRPMWLQALVSGLVAAQAYAVGAAVRALVGPVLAAAGRRVPWRVRRWADRGLLAALALLLATAVSAGHSAQVRLATTMGLPAPSPATQVAAAALALVIGTGIVIVVRRAVVRLRRAHPARHASAGLLAAMLTLTGCVAQGQSDRAEAQPELAGERVTWASLGAQGRRFVADAPDANAISAVTGRPAYDPVRVYVDQASAANPAARARLAVQELERAGAFDRAVLVVVVPTGSGWVNPAAVSALEYLHGGDVASIAMQYSASPSWLTYLRGTGSVRASARALLETVRAKWAQLPTQRRPRLLVYGESLGALGGMSAYSTLGAVHHTAAPTDGALWVGVPAVADAHRAAHTLSTIRVHTLVHPDDPVAAWSPRLLLQPTPDWPHRWYPLVTFWQATADMAATFSAPTGHGHTYAAELVDAWRAVAPSDNTATRAPLDRLAKIRTAVLTTAS